MKRLFKKLSKKTISHQPFDYAQGRTEPAEVQKTRLSASSLNNSGSEFPDVTEQTSLVSEVLGRAPSGSFRSIISALTSTFIGDGLSTNIMSPTDSSATLPSNYQSSTESANLSRSIKKKGLIMFRRLMRFFSNKPNQNQCNDTQKSGYLSLSNLRSEINHISSKNLSVKTAKGSLVANIAKNQAATKLEQTAENTFNWALVIVNINYTLAKIKYAVNENL